MYKIKMYFEKRNIFKVILCLLTVVSIIVNSPMVFAKDNDASDLDISIYNPDANKTHEEIWNEVSNLPVVPDSKSKERWGTYPIRPGLILVTRDWYNGVVPTGHAAIVKDKYEVVESYPDGGVQYGYNNWMTSKNSAFGVNVDSTSASDDVVALEWCKARIGYPYNWSFANPNKRDSFYCSQLVWAAYKDCFGINLDPDGGSVYPYDMVQSPYVSVVYSQ